MYNPLTMLLHGGFGILQAENRTNKPKELQFKTGWTNVRDNLTHPFYRIRRYGTANFFKREVFPLEFDSKYAYFWPNYTNHLIGGGISYRMMLEWFDAHNFPHGKALALVTIMSYHLLNEIIENDDYQGTNVDPIANSWIFDPLSILLFSNDTVLRFLSNKLNLTDWSFQFAINPYSGGLYNFGQNFMMRYPIYNDRFYAFYLFGNHGEAGISFRVNDTDCFSVGFGVTSYYLYDLSTEPDVRRLTAELAPSGGFFWDRNRSLLASRILTGRDDVLAHFNIYPGALFRSNRGLVSPGAFIQMSPDFDLVFGITFARLPVNFASKQLHLSR